MCGIVGVIGPDARKLVSEMNAEQVHRGPDTGGVFWYPKHKLALGMRRLSIVDLKEGAQPMTSPDGGTTIVFNGEIFNAPSLRKELELKGEVFTTKNSDTEVVLRLYRRYGQELPRFLNGMFAFVIFDRDKQELFGARDRSGIKPLHFF